MHGGRDLGDGEPADDWWFLGRERAKRTVGPLVDGADVAVERRVRHQAGHPRRRDRRHLPHRERQRVDRAGVQRLGRHEPARHRQPALRRRGRDRFRL